MEKRAVLDRLTAAQALIECGRASLCMNLHGNGEVELVNVAGANPILNSGDALGVFMLCN